VNADYHDPVSHPDDLPNSFDRSRCNKPTATSPEERVMRIVLVSVIALVLSACATSYVPYAMHGLVRYGYTDEQLQPDVFAVEFAGSLTMSREHVLDYAVLRGAELCQEHEYPYWHQESGWTRVLYRQDSGPIRYTTRLVIRCLETRRTHLDLDVDRTVTSLRDRYSLDD